MGKIGEPLFDTVEINLLIHKGVSRYNFKQAVKKPNSKTQDKEKALL